MFYVYVLYSKKLDKFYIGTTDNFDKRILDHNTGSYNGSYTKKGIPWTLHLLIDELKSSEAYSIEKHIKQMKSRKYLNDLLKYPWLLKTLREKYS